MPPSTLGSLQSKPLLLNKLSNVSDQLLPFSIRSDTTDLRSGRFHLRVCCYRRGILTHRHGLCSVVTVSVLYI